jgi:hypothetical protein
MMFNFFSSKMRKISLKIPSVTWNQFLLYKRSPLYSSKVYEIIFSLLETLKIMKTSYKHESKLMIKWYTVAVYSNVKHKNSIFFYVHVICCSRLTAFAAADITLMTLVVSLIFYMDWTEGKKGWSWRSFKFSCFILKLIFLIILNYCFWYLWVNFYSKKNYFISYLNNKMYSKNIFDAPFNIEIKSHNIILIEF